jgi:hypothetical protein
VRAVENWHSRYQYPSACGESGEGHDAYCMLLNAAATTEYSEAHLIRVLKDGLRTLSF